MTPTEVQALADALEGVVDTRALRACALPRPRRVAVVGRVGVGKTSLINRLTGAARPVGLGGVTRAVERVPDGDTEWLDTPGIDDPSRAIDALGPALEDVDRVIWVLDGLQPATWTEREVLRLLLAPGAPVDAVVSRADLLGEDLQDVLDRARAHTAAFGPGLVIARDLRPRGDLVASGDAERLRRVRPSARIDREVERAVIDAERAFVAIRPPIDPAGARELLSVRGRVRARLDPALADPEGSSVPDLVVGFRRALGEVADALVVAAAADPALAAYAGFPELPPVPDPGERALDVLRLGAAGRTAVARELKALAAGWVAECEVRLADWLGTLPADAGAARRWRRARAALDGRARPPAGSRPDPR